MGGRVDPHYVNVREKYSVCVRGTFEMQETMPHSKSCLGVTDDR